MPTPNAPTGTDSAERPTDDINNSPSEGPSSPSPPAPAQQTAHNGRTGRAGTGHRNPARPRTAQQQRTSARQRPGPSATMTMTIAPDQAAAAQAAGDGVLWLQAPPQPARRIQWAEDVVDNEGMGKKSSKICCIYHPPHSTEADSESETESSEESSEESSSSDDDDDDSDASVCEHGHRHRPYRPNAYERQPRYKKRPNQKPSS